MAEIQNYGSFIMAILLFQLFPGAGTVAILTATATNGIRSGMSAVLGTITGDIIYMFSAVLGLAAILNQYPVTLKIAQYAGVIYLIYLGVKKIITASSNQLASDQRKISNKHIYKESLAICLTNPKAILFFMAFFPLFLSQEPKSTTLALMMAHVTMISLIYQTLLVLVGNKVAIYFSRWKKSKTIAIRIAGLALIGFGVKLARSIK